MRVGLVGDGDRFDALVALLGQTNTETVLWNYKRQRKKDLPDGVESVPLKEFRDIPLIFVSVTMDEVRDVARSLGDHTTGRHAVVHLCRNLEHKSLKTVSQVLHEEMPTHRYAFLTGPMLREDVLKGLPASGVCATTYDEIMDYVKEVLVSSSFRLYRNHDIRGAELAAAYCRVIAMAAGVASELHLGMSIQSTLFSRGLAEMGRFVAYRGGLERTTFGLSGCANLFIDSAAPGSPDFQIGAEAMKKNIFDHNAVIKKFGTRGKDMMDLVESLAVVLEEQKSLDLHLLETCHLMVSGKMGPAEALIHLMSLPVLND